MFQQSRWGKASTTTTYSQQQDLADYLSQQGLFQVGSAGALWDTYEEEPQQVPEPSTALGLLSLGLFGLRLRKQKTPSNLHIQ